MRNVLDTSGAKVKGVHVLSFFDMRGAKALALGREIEALTKDRPQIIRAARRGEAEAILNDAVDRELFSLKQHFERLLRAHYDTYRQMMAELQRFALIRQQTIENITTTVGRAVLAQRLAAITTYTGVVNYCALGSNNTGAVVGDTKLNTEVYRKALSTGAASSNIAYLETFFTKTEVTGTFEEYGFFIDGTGAADSGQLFNRFVGSTTKSGTESLNVQSTITLSDA